MIQNIFDRLGQSSSLAGFAVLGALCDSVARHGLPHGWIGWVAVLGSAIGASGAIAKSDQSAS